MAVQVETEADTSAGAAVSVTLSAGTMVSGTVESCAAGKVTVTLTDDGTVFGDTVTVTDGNGRLLGTGTLCIHQPLEVTGTSGQVSVVHVAENQWVEAGEELLTLADVSVSAEYQELLAVRTVYKEKLKELLSLADGCAVTAPVDGVIECDAYRGEYDSRLFFREYGHRGKSFLHTGCGDGIFRVDGPEQPQHRMYDEAEHGAYAACGAAR